ncbi:Cytochrome c oxidase assembly protein cox11, mitochondrial [Naganishia albida]|nr:Cytochrome c oxidase assembly protein cox11, mitochondrial [Naganishia albida]
MGLAERKNKQKIGNDPRNLTWSQDTNRFSFQHLQKFGWDPSKGLGTSHDGNPNHIKVVKKLDAGGIGITRALKEGAEIGGAGEGLDAVLKRLKAAGTGPIVFNDDDEEDNKDSSTESAKEDSPAVSGAESLTVPIVAPEPRRIMAARNKYIKSKRLASQSPAAMAEILGIPVSALPASGASTPVPTLHKAHLNTSSALAGEPLNADSGNPSPAPSDTKPDDARTEDMISTAPISVFEYFRRKLAQKKAEREGLPVPEMSYATEGYSDVAKDFEGKKIKFDTDEDEEDAPTNTGIGSSSSNSTSVNSPVEVASQTKEERKAAQKAAKEAEKAAKKAAKAELKRQAGLSAGSSKKDKKRKRGGDADQSAREEGEDARPKKSKSKGKERASDDAEDPETIAKKSKKEKREKRGKGEAAVESTSNVETGTDVPPAKKAKKPKKDVSRVNPSAYASLSRSFRTTSRSSIPPPSTPTQNVASASPAAAGSQPVRGVDNSTAKRLVQEHQRRLYESRKMKSRNAALYVAGALILTLGFTYAAVPAYRAFCSATGFSGVPITDSNRFLPDRLYPSEESAKAKRITVHFEATASDELKWKFTPQQKFVKVLPGETALAFYTAENWGTEDVIGIATYNTTPSRMAPYFAKVECFCFEQQKIRAGETVDLPVFFFIDRDIIDDVSLTGVDDVVLSYTFFKARRNKRGDLEPDAPLDVVERASGFEGYELAKKE